MAFRGVDYFAVDSLFSEEELMVRQTARRFAEAETHYAAYLRTVPNDEKAVTNLGVSLASQGRLPEAVAQFKRAVELNPGSVSARQNLLRAQAMLER